MERSKIAATAAAVFLTTAAGMVAIGANLGLLRIGAFDSKVGTLSPVATPARVTPSTTAAPTPVPEPTTTPEPDTTAAPVADGGSSSSVTWSQAAATTWTSDTAATTAPPPPATSAPTATARAVEPGDTVVAAPSPAGSGDD